MQYPNFGSDGLIPAIVQQLESSRVLMLGYMNREAYEKTLQEAVLYFYSRSRRKLWKKGEVSGHVKKVHEVFWDCDEDVLLIQVQRGEEKEKKEGVCHQGYESCFYRKLNRKSYVLEVSDERVFDPKEVYSKARENLE